MLLLSKEGDVSLVHISCLLISSAIEIMCQMFTKLLHYCLLLSQESGIVKVKIVTAVAFWHLYLS